MYTILSKNYPAYKESFDENLFQVIRPYVESCFSDIDSFFKEIHCFFQANRSVYIPGMDIYLDTKAKILLPNLNDFEVSEIFNIENVVPGRFAFDESVSLNYMCELPKVSILRQKKKLLSEMYGSDSCFVCICDDKGYTNYIGTVVVYYPDGDRVSKKIDTMAKTIPIINLEYDSEKELIVDHLIASGLYFGGLSEDADNCFRDLILCYKHYPGCVKLSNDGKICFSAIRRIIRDYMTDGSNDWIKALHWDFIDEMERTYHAVCALQEYAFEPDGDEEYVYGVFEIEGCTTNRDLILLEQIKNEKFKFGIDMLSVQEHFYKHIYDVALEDYRSRGDEFLGERFLEMIAFEIIKANQLLMRAKGFKFILPAEYKEFSGADSLIATSQEAKNNMHNLMERISFYLEEKSSRYECIDETEQDTYTLLNLIGEAVASHSRQAFIEKEVAVVERFFDAEIITEYDARTELKNIIDKYGIELDEELRFVVDLFDEEGKEHVNEILWFSSKKMDELIESRI